MSSNVFCERCSYEFGAREMGILLANTLPNKVLCPLRHPNWIETARVKLADDCKPFRQKKNILNASWYHITQKNPEDWFWKPASAALNWRDSSTHIGTLKTVQAYKRQMYKGRDVKLFKFELDPKARIFPRVVEDDNAWAGWIDRLCDDETDVIRYINRYENSGQMSCLVNPAVLRLTRVTETTLHA